MSGPGWFLPLEAVNEFQARTIQRTIDRAKHAHHTDVDMRINGKNEHFEADWIKHMVPVTPGVMAARNDTVSSQSLMNSPIGKGE